MKRLKRVERGRNCSLSLSSHRRSSSPEEENLLPVSQHFQRVSSWEATWLITISKLFFSRKLWSLLRLPLSLFFSLSLFFFLLGGWKWKSCSSTSGGFCLALNGVRGLIGYGWTTRRDFWWRIRFVGGGFYVKLGRDCGGWYLFRNFSLDQSIICLFSSLQDLCVFVAF